MRLMTVLMLAGATALSQVAVAQRSTLDSGALIEKYCTGCHNGEDFAGGLDLLAASAHTLADKADVGERVIKRLRAGMMPPVGKDRPSYDTVQELARALEQGIDKHAATQV